MTWGTPRSGDIVWCYVPYRDQQGRIAHTRHPALVLDVDPADSGPASQAVTVVIAGGSSLRKPGQASTAGRLQRAVDFRIDATDACFARTGLQHATLFHLNADNVHRLPYNEDFFVAPPGKTPRMGRLDPTDKAVMTRLAQAARAAGLAATLLKRRPRSG